MKKKIVTISGIRPDFIRMSSIFKALDEEPTFEHILVHTGQHYDSMLSDVFFKDLNIRKPDIHMSVGGANKKHYDVAADLTQQLTPLMLQIKPDLIIFLGDSNTVTAAVALKKEGFKICHIEAGMRSGDMRMLEEVNRIVCDHVTDLHFVYHSNYAQKLKKENLTENVHVVGNTIVEPLRKIEKIVKKEMGNDIKRKHILLDIHRPENFKYTQRMSNIIAYAAFFGDYFKVPVKMLEFHNTKKLLTEYKIDLPPQVNLVPLMGFKDYVKSQLESVFIFSDSGTAQEEPILLDRRTVVPRDYTERPESVETMGSFMLNVNEYSATTCINLCEKLKELENVETSKKWLGSGKTSKKIINIIKEFLA